VVPLKVHLRKLFRTFNNEPLDVPAFVTGRFIVSVI